MLSSHRDVTSAGELRAMPLLEAGQTVETVALDLGYGSASAFITMFKRLVGATPDEFRKGGLVRDPASYALVEARMRQACAALGWLVLDYFESPITGGDGNREFFVWACP